MISPKIPRKTRAAMAPKASMCPPSRASPFAPSASGTPTADERTPVGQVEPALHLHRLDHPPRNAHVAQEPHRPKLLPRDHFFLGQPRRIGQRLLNILGF